MTGNKMETKIKFCGLRKAQDIEAANLLKPDFIGFVFAEKSKRFIDENLAKDLKDRLSLGIQAVGVFVDEPFQRVAALLNKGIIDLAQLHGSEDEAYIGKLRKLTEKPVIKAFKVTSFEVLKQAENSSADYILLDSGAGTGKVFDWSISEEIERPYFLAGGLTLENVSEALKLLHPFGVDVSSGIETDGAKDKEKMQAFFEIVRRT